MGVYWPFLDAGCTLTRPHKKWAFFKGINGPKAKRASLSIFTALLINKVAGKISARDFERPVVSACCKAVDANQSPI
jgi:hypothetical protein